MQIPDYKKVDMIYMVPGFLYFCDPAAPVLKIHDFFL
jgi:hypothetical protein